MTLQQLFYILRARWRLCAVIWCGVVGLVIGISVLVPKHYTSTGAVVVDTRGIDALTGTGPNNGGLVPGYIATQVDVAQSERVVSAAARALHLDNSDELHAQWLDDTEGRGDFMAWITEQLQRRLTVRPTRDSNVMTLSFTDRDPKFSSDMASALVQAYIDTTLELRVEPAKQYNQFFDERSRALRESLENAQKRLSAYQRQSGLLASDERFDIESARLAELSSQVVAMQNAAAESGSRTAEAAIDPERVAEVLNSSLISSLTSELSRQESRLQEIRARFGDNHPQIVEAQASIAELRNRVAAAKLATIGSVGATNSIVRVRLGAAQAALAQQRSRVVQLKAKRDESAVLQRDVENAQRTYDAVVTRVSQTDLDSQNRQTNVSVLKYPKTPAFAAWPRVFLNAAVAVLLGALLAIAAAWLREIGDRRLRFEADVSQLLAVPMLLVLPRASLPGRKGHARLARKKMQILSGGPTPATS